MTTTWSQIQSMAKECGAKYPELVAAQWALESAWGTALSGKNNFFGIKGKGTRKETKEWSNGKFITIVAEFHDFATPRECVQHLVTQWYTDYKSYKGVNNAPNREEAARELVRQKYATDPQYADKLINLMSKNVPPTKPSTSVSKMAIGPTKKPQDFGFKPGDTHLVVNDISETAKAYSYEGQLLWEVPCLARGQGADNQWQYTNTDTPPGLYKIGTIYRDYNAVGPNPPYDRTLMAYGWNSFDLIELENQEAKYGRAGIMIHGGGSANGWPGAWEPMQPLCITHGCVRMHNKDTQEKLLPLADKGTVFVSVWQEG